VTRLPLLPENLIPMRAAQHLIDMKLRVCQELWTNILKVHPDLRGVPSRAEDETVVNAAREELGAENFN
jgi:hypothetical protein